MIYRRPIRDVVEERHGRVCGVHLFVIYAVALTAVLGMSSACLSATRSGYFKYSAEGVREEDSGFKYEITYGWRLMCYRVFGATENSEYYGCFGLDETKPVELEDADNTEEALTAGSFITAGSSMTADTGLAVALGHVVVVLITLIHLLFFLLLLGKIEPMPVRGYLYMRGLGLMSALASFYLIFTCVVSFFFGVKDSLDSEMSNSAGLRPSWAYIVTVVDVGLMMMVAIKACQDDEVDSAIATPQYTSSSRDEDTVKRASGKLLHLRSKSSDTILEGSITNVPTSAPKATVGDSGMSGVHLAPTARVALVRAPRIVGPTLPTSSFTVSSSAAASAAAAAAAAAAASVSAIAVASTEGAASPVPSSSVRSSWTEKVSGFSPVRHRGDAYVGVDGDGNVDGPEEKDVRERDIEGGMLVDWMLDGARREDGVDEDDAEADGQEEQEQQRYRRDEDSLEDDVGDACASHDGCGDDVEEGGRADQREGHIGGSGTEDVGVMGGLGGKGPSEEEGEDEGEKEDEVQGSRFHRTRPEICHATPGGEHEAIYRQVSVVRSSLAEFSTAKTAVSVGFDDPDAAGKGRRE